MNNEPWWSNIEKKLPWSFLGVLLALIFGAYAVYTTVAEKTPEIEYQLSNSANIFDLHKPLKDLKIFFMGEDIQEKKQNLRIYTIRVSNVGKIDILESYYDSKQPWGIKFLNGEIVEIPRIVDSNTDYLTNNIKPNIKEKNIVNIDKIIFEHGKYFTIEVLVLHDKDSIPELEILGKIAGIDDPVVTTIDTGEKSLINQVFIGGWAIQIIRMLFYLLVMVMFIGIAIFISQLLFKADLKKKEKLLNESVEPFIKELTPEDGKFIKKLSLRTNINIDQLRELHTELTNEDSRKPHLDEAKYYFSMREKPHIYVPLQFDFMTKLGDGTIGVDESLTSLLYDFIEYLEERAPE
jgi:hypothetical protein